ncbi:hypothetical protein CBQ28_17805 [Pseudoalteromonas sp. GCY]|nr:hypothetical protein CBQ28_17805 [Pseudoalteromonas sp. GCY]
MTTSLLNESELHLSAQCKTQCKLNKPLIINSSLCWNTFTLIVIILQRENSFSSQAKILRFSYPKQKIFNEDNRGFTCTLIGELHQLVSSLRREEKDGP